MHPLFELPRVLFVHAHPDDETLATGALIAALVAAGVQVDLVTATRGERGKVVPGSTSAAEGSDELTAHRIAELDAACAVLGVHRHCFLGEPPARVGAPGRVYADSGMEWLRPGLAGPAADVSEQALTRVELIDATTDLAAAVETWRPAALVSYDDAGSYGHPDHIRVHEITRAVADATRLPFYEVASTPETPAEVRLDLSDHREQVRRALAHYASQLSLDSAAVDAAEIVHVGGQREQIAVDLGLTRVQAD